MISRILWRLLLLFIISIPLCKASEKNEEIWINQYRQSHNLNLVKEDSLLSQCAVDYAKNIANSGVFAHKDQKGQRALERYLSTGGSESEVGEILGAGLNTKTIINAWKASYTHREVIKKKRWTHFGEGKYLVENKLIYVILFIQKHAEELIFGWQDHNNEWAIEGVWCYSDKKPILLNGIKRQKPVVWDNKNRVFEFRIPESTLSSYLRLGYNDSQKKFIVTHLFYPYKQK